MNSLTAVRLMSFLFLVSSVVTSASAQSRAQTPNEFGTGDGIDLWIPRSQFTGTATTWAENIGFGYFSSSAPGSFHADLRLPQGAYLDSWTAFYYDGSDAADFTIGLVKWLDDTTSSPAPHNQVLHTFTSSGTPGFAIHERGEGVTIDLREPWGPSVTREQAADFYTFYIVMPNDALVLFKGVRVIWHRQVSPAPATASFNDVPTSDPAFQHIEALVASGITAGCGNGNYCPNATLTRRQMAVFLAKALGLHWQRY